MPKLLFSFFLLGLSFGIGPCLASCGPLLVSYAAGTGKKFARSALIYCVFSFSRILVYAGLGLAVFSFGHLVTRYAMAAAAKFIFTFAGLFIIIIGLLVMLGKNINHAFCRRMQGLFLKQDTWTVVIFGLTMGILPCAPLISVVSYIGIIARSWINALVYSLAFGLGTAVSPLFILVVFAGWIPGMMSGKERLYRVFNFICGLAIIFLGAQLFKRAF